jgi:hypothetical protein
LYLRRKEAVRRHVDVVAVPTIQNDSSWITGYHFHHPKENNMRRTSVSSVDMDGRSAEDAAVTARAGNNFLVAPNHHDDERHEQTYEQSYFASRGNNKNTIQQPLSSLLQVRQINDQYHCL